MRAAVVELREVAHGLFPTVLADEGLGAGDRRARPSTTPRLVAARLPDGRFPDAVESAAYFADARGAARSPTRDGDRRRASPRTAACGSTIAAEGTLDGAITQIEDRVGAAGGTVAVRHGELLLELPCAS